MRTKVLKINPSNPDPLAIHEAAAVLRRGGLVAFPTETVYGLGANLNDPQAIQELYQVKERPFEKKVTLHIADFKVLEDERAIVTPLAWRLMERFWPGPLTLVLPKEDGAPRGFRMPNHPVALALLREAQVPVVAPSANKSGNPPPRTAKEVLRDLAEAIDVVLDAGPTPGGVESTVLDLASDPPKILRPGAMASEIEAVLRQEAAAGGTGSTSEGTRMSSRPPLGSL